MQPCTGYPASAHGPPAICRQTIRNRGANFIRSLIKFLPAGFDISTTPFGVVLEVRQSADRTGVIRIWYQGSSDETTVRRSVRSLLQERYCSPDRKTAAARSRVS